jgi:DNA-binding transcriptional regulator YiaG
MKRRQATATQPYHYTLSGLSKVYLHGITVHICPACGSESPVIPRVAGLHRVIAEIVARKPAPLVGEEIRFLRKNIGIPAKKLAAVLGIAPETLSRAENGRPGGLRPALEHLVRLMARTAGSGETTREAVLSLAEQMHRESVAPKAVKPIALAPGRKGGWKKVA